MLKNYTGRKMNCSTCSKLFNKTRKCLIAIKYIFDMLINNKRVIKLIISMTYF